MNNNHNKIEEVFETWGKSKRETPPNNDTLKNSVLSKIENAPLKIPTPYYGRLPWLSFAFTAMAIVVIFVNSGSVNLTKNYTNSDTGFATSGSSTPSPSMVLPQREIKEKDDRAHSQKQIYLPQPPKYYENSPISDNREFLKVDYNATLHTRHIDDLKTKIEILARGFGGRIDNSNSSEKFGYVSFAIPKDQFEIFKTQIKSLVGDKFYVEQINSENLLPQKQMIEENQKQIEKSLSDLKVERAQIVKTHNQVIYQYQNSVNSKKTEMSALNTEYVTATTWRQSQIINILNQLQTEINTINSQITSENKNYQQRIGGVDEQIKYMQQNLTSTQTQDKNLLNNVATVNGSISLNWISLWDMADAYLPGPILTWIFFACAILAYLWYRQSVKVSYDYF